MTVGTRLDMLCQWEYLILHMRIVIASFPGSPTFSDCGEKRGKPGKTYHVSDVKGRKTVERP